MANAGEKKEDGHETIHKLTLASLSDAIHV
jgi:hypothetical protein